MAAAKSFTQTQFGGGINTNLVGIAPDQATELINVDVSSGALVAMRSPAKLATADNYVNSLGDLIPQSQASYVRSDGIACPLKKLEHSIWLGVPQMDYDRDIIGAPAPVGAKWDMRNLAPASPYAVLTGYGGAQLYGYDMQTEELWSGKVARFNGSTAHMVHNPTVGYAESWFRFGVTAFSISFWVKPTPIRNGIRYWVVSKFPNASPYNGYEIQIIQGAETSGQIFWYQYQTDTDYWARTATVPYLFDGKWHHIVCVRATDGTHMPIYVDGATPSYSDEGSASPCNITTPDALTIGCPSYYHCVDGFHGLLGTLSFHTGAMTLALAQAQYNGEKAYYGAPVEVTHRFYPLLGAPETYDAALHGGEQKAYIAARSRVSAEAMRQVGSYLYCSPENGDPTEFPLRWDGMIIRKGRVTGVYGAPGTVYTLYGDDHNEWDQGNILPGDTIYVVDHSIGVGTWDLRGETIQYVDTVNKRVQTHGGGWTTTGKGEAGGNNCRYCIVRVHRAGVPPGTTCTAVASAGGALPQPETYRYCWRYGNSRTGYFGNISAESADVSTTAANQTVTVSGWAAQPPELDVDTLQIFRARMDVGTADHSFYLVATVSPVTHGVIPVLGWTGYYRADLANYVEAAAPTLGVALETYPNVYDRPPRMRQMRLWNNRLVGVGVETEVNRGYQSIIDAYECFPDVQWDWNGLTAQPADIGTRVDVGRNRGESVLAVVPEQGSYSVTGTAGANLLMILPSRAVRWYGYTSSDWMLDEAFPLGTAAPKTILNAGGILFGLFGDHVMILAPGSNYPRIISLALWPRGIREAMTATDKQTALAAFSGGFWQGCYLLSGSLSGAVPDTTWVYDVEKGTWRKIDRGYNDFCVWHKVGSAQGEVVTGSRSVAVSGTGDLEALFSGTPTGTFKWRSGPLPIFDRESITRSKYHLDRVFASIKNPVGADQTATLKVFVAGENTTAAYSGNRTLANDATDTGKRTIVEWAPTSGDGDFLQIELSATLSREISVEWVRCEYTEHV